MELIIIALIAVEVCIVRRPPSPPLQLSYALTYYAPFARSSSGKAQNYITKSQAGSST
jgi:hypothetical protein